ncbi:phosphatidylcholine and lysophosphatidylcholine phospholipase, partial [Coemansia sp. RSA 2611]
MSGGGAIVGGRATGRAVVAAAVCMATLAVAGLAARAAEADTGVVSTERQTGLEQRSVGSGVLRHIGAALGTIAMLVVVGLGFVVIDVLVPAATALARVAVRATASAGASVCVGVAIGVWGLYYFRYYYAAPPKQAPGLDSAKGADRFDLHPDVAREDSDSAYMGLLESDDDAAKVLRGGLGGAGFPADFLKMFMKSISIFGYIEEAVFHEFSRQLQTRRLLAGEQMFDGEGDRDDLSFYVVIDGRVEIFLAGEPVAGGSEETGSGSEAGEWAASGQSESGAESDSEASGSPEAAAAAGGPQLASKSAILLNTVGPGDVLSSLFSILSLFTEDVPLHPGRCQPPGAAEDPGRHALDAYRFGRLDAQAAAGGSGESAADARPPRPNVVARATTDTTLAMIPAAAFQRVTRLYPTAAAHILQVILTRLQRVTFATLYDYLDLPDELVAIERAIGALARRPLRAEIAGSETLRQIRQLYAHHEPLAPSRASPPADAGHMPAAWRIDRASLDLLLGPASSRRSSLRHRRAGSDAEPASAAPSDAALAGLRRAVFHQLCDALGIDPY